MDKQDELSLNEVKRRSVAGVVTLTGRTFILQIISLFATFLLTIYLDPAQYGIFFLVSAVVNFFAYFSDIGLAAALIQKHKKPTQDELRTTFTVQQILVFILMLVIFIATPLFEGFYNLSRSSIMLLWTLAFSLFLSSLKTIPSIMLERRLDFNKLIIPQIVETLLFYGAAVYFAWKGFGITSFTVAVLLRGFTGLILIYLLQPWKPGIAFSRKALSELLRFGLPYQLNTFLAVLKDDGMIMVLGGILGPAGVGLLGWAQKWAQAPLRFFMDQVIKVTFPAFARMQENKQELTIAVSRSIFFVCLLVFPALVGLIIIASPLIEIIPRYEKWRPAVLALGLLSFNAAWAAVTTPLTNVLNAIGKITTTLKLMLMWTVLTWVFVPVLTFTKGLNGAALGYVLVGLSSTVAIYLTHRLVKFNIKEAVIKPLLAALGMGVVLVALRSLLSVTAMTVVALIGSGVVTYVLLLYLFVGSSLLVDVGRFLNAVKTR